MSILAIDIGGTKFSMAVFEDGRMAGRESRATDRQGGRDWMLGQIEGIAGEWRSRFHLKACGIGFGGPVDFATQRIACSTHVGGWQDFLLTNWVKERLGLPTIMDNDANTGALGEAVYGAGQGCDPLFYMTVSTGIGGGIVVNSDVYRGADSFAGEVGHIPIRPEGPVCLCGARGCFERICGGLGLERDHGRPAHELFQDPAFVRGYVADLALGLKTVLLLLNPARIVIGGGISKAGDALFTPLREELRCRFTAWSRARIDVEPARLGDDSVLYGALALALRKERK